MADRRCNGEGSIFKRRDGRWAATVSLGDGRRKTYYGKTRQLVSQKLAKALVEVQQGLPVIPEKELVSSYLDRWLEDIAKPTIRPTTYEGYERMIRLHVISEIGRVRLARLSPDHFAVGANSSGKSTVLHALHYAREVFDRHNLEDVDQTIAGGRYIDLGGFEHFIHRRDPDNVLHAQKRIRVRIDLGIKESPAPRVCKRSFHPSR